MERIKTVHVPGAANVEADWLSRPSKWQSQSVPHNVRDIKVVEPKGRDETFYGLPSLQSRSTEDPNVRYIWSSIR